METKKEKFARLAEARTNRILDQVESLSKLSNTAHYEFSESEINEIFKAIRKVVNRANSAFEEAIICDKEQRFKLNKNEE